jgi:hypothetical protein
VLESNQPRGFPRGGDADAPVPHLCRDARLSLYL